MTFFVEAAFDWPVLSCALRVVTVGMSRPRSFNGLAKAGLWVRLFAPIKMHEM